jgi:hypothetical protein
MTDFLRRVLIFSVVGGLLTLSSCAADNPLIGTWKQDWNRTLQELKVPTEGTEQITSESARAKRFIQGGARNLGDSVRFAYTDTICTESVV